MNTILDTLNTDPESLLMLLREVYTKGVDDGVQSTVNKTPHIFRGWDYTSNLLDSECDTIEDFIDILFNMEDGYYENTY